MAIYGQAAGPNDNNLYTANGDGSGFSDSFAAMRVSQIAGMPPQLTGTSVAGDVGMNYTGSTGYTDKPTGMLCINNAIYLAFQNLNENDFEYAPAASIVSQLIMERPGLSLRARLCSAVQ